MTASVTDEASHPATSDGVGCTFLSGKGGAGKSFMCFHCAGEASAQKIPTLLADADPERNLTSKFVGDHPDLQDARGLADVLIAAGVLDGDDDFDVAAGAALLKEVIVRDVWPNVDYLPAGKKLNAVSQQTLSGENWQWLVREIFEEAELYDRYKLLLLDSAGRRGSLVTMLMYACDVAISPITDMDDSIAKAEQAKARVEAIQSSHPLKWGGVVITGLDLRAAINQVIRADAAATFGAELDKEGQFVTWGEVIAEIPYRSGSIHEAYHMGQRLVDRPATAVRELRTIFSGLLHDHVLNAHEHAGAEK
jgi:cellulose biosynthesis protein BcsQ